MIRSNNPAAIADRRWQAILDRDGAAADDFFYAVRSTGIYCRPGCASRLPRRQNVEFFDSPLQAELAGYRACKRCQPGDSAKSDPNLERLTRACRFIEQAERMPSLDAVAREVKLSPHHLHRLFKEQLGLTPRAYAAARRVGRLQQALAEGNSVTDAIYAAGYHSSGRCYAEAEGVLGMSPRQYRARGKEQTIRFALTGCSLGRLLVAVTEKGVCQIALGDNDASLRDQLLATFPAAKEVKCDERLAELLAEVVAFVDAPTAAVPFPLDIRGTAFQRRVWQALQQIPPGETRTYRQLAAAVGQPTAVRAVASACAANTLAVAVPCHRVLRSNGQLSGYRWGPGRKQKLLDRERT